MYRCLHRCITSVCVYVFIAIPGCIAYYSCMHTYGWSDVSMLSCSCVVWCGVVCWDVWGWGRYRRSRRIWRRRITTELPRCTLHRKMAAKRSPNCWWYVRRDKEGGNVYICWTRGRCGGGRMSAIDIHLDRHVYGFFLSIYTYTYILLCVFILFQYSYTCITAVCMPMHIYIYRVIFLGM